MHFIKISGKVNSIDSYNREIRIPIDEVRWWGESRAPRFETEIKLSNGDIILTQIPINKLDKIMDEALEKKEK